MGNKTVKLGSPILIAGKTISELTLHEPKAKHLRGLKFGMDGQIETDVLLDLACNLTGELPAVIDELSFSDLVALGAAAQDFLPDGWIPTGKQE